MAQTEFVGVAGNGVGLWACGGGCLRYNNWLVGATMMCSADRWLSSIALQIGCRRRWTCAYSHTSSQNDATVLAGGGWVCGETFASWSYLKERLCSQSRVCVQLRGTTTRSRGPLASQELTLTTYLATGDLLKATPRKI